MSWALEVGEVAPFSSLRKAYSYCGLTAATRESVGKEHRGPLSKLSDREAVERGVSWRAADRTAWV